MYTLVSAIGEPAGGGNRWRAVEIGAVPMNVLYSTYSHVIAVLSNTFFAHHVSLDLLAIRDQYGTSPLTFNQMLASLGNEALPTSTTLPELKTRYAHYADAVRAGYKIQPVHPTWAADAEMPPSERTWLRMTRPGLDYALFKRHCLVTVNGLYHQVDADSTGIYITEGNRSRLVSGHNQIGVYSLRNLGALQTIPITPAMVYKQKPEQSLRHRAYIDVGVDMSQKTVLLVIGGYLHVLDRQTVFRTSDTALGVDLENMPLFERYHESRKYLDLSSLELETTERNASQIGVNDFLSDAVLTRYLSLPQSFIVLLDNPRVFVDHVPVHTTRMPGVFISGLKPTFPLVVGRGLHTNYWHTHEDRQWSLTTHQGVVDQPLYRTTDAAALQGVSDSRTPGDRFRLSNAKFLQLGRDL